jgi:uridine monophosphate synthetase
MAATAPHPSWILSYRERASLPTTGPLAAYLLQLMTIKQSNLCLSADVLKSDELLTLAEELGDHICILKTHCDIITDWSERTSQKLKEIARRKYFVVFEDRKFADIGGTVQKQYTAGYHRIATWAEITNAHILPGPAIVTALAQAATQTIEKYNTAVHTEISSNPALNDDEDEESHADIAIESPQEDGTDERRLSIKSNDKNNDRKHSVVSISTTISTRTESISPRPEPNFHPDEALGGDVAARLLRLGELPFLRSLLLLAEMSSEGHLLTPEYSRKCVEIARQNSDFVMGFIAQRSLNTEPGDNFLTMTPGCQLPPPDAEGKKLGDGLGQQYNTPRKLIYEQGCDVIIVGRGILNAQDKLATTIRYKEEGWKAYQERIGAAQKKA